MQSYSHPDVFFCPLYNRPGISDPKMNLCGSEDEPEAAHSLSEEVYAVSPTEIESPFVSSPTSPRSSATSSPTSSRSPSLSPSPSSPSEGTRDKRVHKFKRMSAKSGRSLLDFASELQSRRVVSTKRQQVKSSQISRKAPGQP